MKKIVAILFISLIFFQPLLAQDKSNRGKEFWVGYGFDYSFFNEKLLCTSVPSCLQQ